MSTRHLTTLGSLILGIVMIQGCASIQDALEKKRQYDQYLEEKEKFTQQAKDETTKIYKGMSDYNTKRYFMNEVDVIGLQAVDKEEIQGNYYSGVEVSRATDAKLTKIKNDFHKLTQTIRQVENLPKLDYNPNIAGYAQFRSYEFAHNPTLVAEQRPDGKLFKDGFTQVRKATEILHANRTEQPANFYKDIHNDSAKWNKFKDPSYESYSIGLEKKNDVYYWVMMLSDKEAQSYYELYVK